VGYALLRTARRADARNTAAVWKGAREVGAQLWTSIRDGSGRTVARTMRIVGIAVLGTVLVGALVAFLVALASLIAIRADSRAPVPLYPGGTMMVTTPTVFVVVSLVGGALGGTLHGVASLTAHVAKGNFDKKWTLWYLANPFPSGPPDDLGRPHWRGRRPRPRRHLVTREDRPAGVGSRDQPDL